MAAARGGKKPSAKKPPKVVEAEPEEDEEEDDEEVTPKQVLATYDPATHVCVPADTFHLLLQAKQQVDEADIRRTEADARRIQLDKERHEATFSSFATGANLQADQIQRAYEFGNMQRDEAERQRSRVSHVEMQMAQMVRQSEDAKLERDRLAADLTRGQVALERLEMELKSKQAMRQAELDAVKEVSKPVFAVAGQGLMQFLMTVAQKNAGVPGVPGMGPPGGLPAGAPVGPTAAGRSQPEVDLFLENTDEFKAAWSAVYDKLTPRSIACLRALVCSALPNAPDFPDHVKDRLMRWVVEDAGDIEVMTLLKASATAYVEVEPPAGANGVTSGAGVAPN
jgi:hypothetical protein